jgi:hypothetical protein
VTISVQVKREFWAFAILLTLATIPGCSGATAAPSIELYPVSGEIFLDGEPATGVSITLIPKGDTKGQSSFGVVEGDGTFRLKYVDGSDGCPAGSYSAIFMKMETPDGSPIPEGKTAMDVGARDVIPSRFKNRDNPKFDVTVTEGGKAGLKFELSRK